MSAYAAISDEPIETLFGRLGPNAGSRSDREQKHPHSRASPPDNRWTSWELDLGSEGANSSAYET
jgi:hypothetical protein